MPFWWSRQLAVREEIVHLLWERSSGDRWDVPEGESRVVDVDHGGEGKTIVVNEVNIEERRRADAEKGEELR